eukprot:13586457-Alexandrium_andersonii.AAC.1
MGARVTRRSKWTHFSQANSSVQLEVGDKRGQAIIPLRIIGAQNNGHPLMANYARTEDKWKVAELTCG